MVRVGGYWPRCVHHSRSPALILWLICRHIAAVQKKKKITPTIGSRRSSTTGQFPMRRTSGYACRRIDAAFRQPINHTRCIQVKKKKDNLTSPLKYEHGSERGTTTGGEGEKLLTWRNIGGSHILLCFVERNWRCWSGGSGPRKKKKSNNNQDEVLDLRRTRCEAKQNEQRLCL